MKLCGVGLVLAACALWSSVGAAQELTPRIYWPAPNGTKVVVIGYSYATGDVLVDPSLPIYGADSRIHTFYLGYRQTFDLLGRTANILLELPVSKGTSQGMLFGEHAEGNFFGQGDPGVTLVVNLRGAPTMDLAGFQELRADPRTIIGASLKVLVPVGKYNSDKLVNVGTNRWAVRAEMGCIIPLRPTWLLELEGGVWFFSDDDEYVGGRREQEPIFITQAYLVKRFKPGFWASLDLNFYEGGRQTIGGVELGDVQRNSRVGGTLVIPFWGRHAIKLGASTGVISEYGTDFDQFLVAYQVAF
jgi:hypothetical protein